MFLVLHYMERGRMYMQLKRRIEANGQSGIHVSKEELGIHSRMANRYISFYEVAAVYHVLSYVI